MDVKCESCGKRLTVRKDDPTAHELPLNEAFVVGAYLGGVGYSATRYILNAAEIDFVHDTTFHKAEQELASGLSGAIMEDMKNAIQDEIAFAREDGRVVKINGVEYFLITGIVDGGYVKRTYGHAYDSKAGCAVIIGGKTNKVIYVAARVKTCAVCERTPVIPQILMIVSEIGMKILIFRQTNLFAQPPVVNS